MNAQSSWAYTRWSCLGRAIALVAPGSMLERLRGQSSQERSALFECNQSAPSDRVSNRYWKPEELCAGMTGAYLRQAASQRPSGMHCIAENRVMREVDCRGCLRLEYSLNFSCLYYTSILVLPLH